MSYVLEQFDRNMLPKLGVRASTFRAVLREAVARNVANIVETGSARLADNWAGDGQSTLIWGAYAKTHSARLVTIDVDQVAVDYVKSLGLSHTEAVCANSVDYLSQHANGIDLLYLDSYDLDMKNPHPAALHCLFELTAAKRCLHPGSIVFVDDSPTDYQGVVNGKGMYVAEYFKHLDVWPFTTGYQVAWLMP